MIALLCNVNQHSDHTFLTLPLSSYWEIKETINKIQSCLLRWCNTRQFATTFFSATQRCNIVWNGHNIVPTLQCCVCCGGILEHAHLATPLASKIRLALLGVRHSLEIKEKVKSITNLSDSNTRQRWFLWKKCRNNCKQWYLSSGSEAFNFFRNSNSLRPVLCLKWIQKKIH